MADVIAEAITYAKRHCAPSGRRAFHLFEGNKFSERAEASIRAAAGASEGSPLIKLYGS